MFIFSLFGIFVAVPNIFLFCFLGKLSSESYRKMGDSLYERNWHELPLKLQKYFMLMIANAQIPQNYHGYGLITLNLETFLCVSQLCWNYGQLAINLLFPSLTIGVADICNPLDGRTAIQFYTSVRPSGDYVCHPTIAFVHDLLHILDM